MHGGCQIKDIRLKKGRTTKGRGQSNREEVFQAKRTLRPGTKNTMAIKG